MSAHAPYDTDACSTRPGGDPVADRKPKIVVGSGWWCDAETHDWSIGDPSTRTSAFFEVWVALVRKYIDPDLIVVIDSHSPIKPAAKARESVTWIELDQNYGHAMDIRKGRIVTKYSGFARSQIMACTHALCCDADYFVYVEQDCVIRGERFIEAALRGTTCPIVVGFRAHGGVGLAPGSIAAPMLQNSLVILRRDGMERFLSALLLAEETDGELAPEEKAERYFEPYEFVAIPYGRSRPIDFATAHFYAQHLSDAELTEFCRLEGIDPSSLIEAGETRRELAAG